MWRVQCHTVRSFELDKVSFGAHPGLRFDSSAHSVPACPCPRTDEAYESLEMLCELFPDFAYIKTLDRQDWLYVKRDARATDVKSKVATELEDLRARQAQALL